MQGTIGPDVARAAVALHKSHPKAPAKEVLDVVMRGRSGSVADFGDSIRAGSDFSMIVAAAFDDAMGLQDWPIVNSPTADPKLVAALVSIWQSHLLPRFAQAYRLTM